VREAITAYCLLREAGGQMRLSTLFARLREKTGCDYDTALRAIEVLFEEGVVAMNDTGMPVVYEKRKLSAQELERLAALLASAFDFYLADCDSTLLKPHQLEEFLVPLHDVQRHFPALQPLVARHGYTFTPVPEGFLVEKKLCKSS
jgi:hypothetical protein